MSRTKLRLAKSTPPEWTVVRFTNHTHIHVLFAQPSMQREIFGDCNGANPEGRWPIQHFYKRSDKSRFAVITADHQKEKTYTTFFSPLALGV